MALTVDGMVGNGLQLENFRLKFFKFVPHVIGEKINSKWPSFVPLQELNLYISLDLQRQCWAWVKLRTKNSCIVLTKNPRHPRDIAPLNFNSQFNQ